MAAGSRQSAFYPPLSPDYIPTHPLRAQKKSKNRSTFVRTIGMGRRRALRLERTGRSLVTMNWLGFDLLRLYRLTIFANHGNERLNGAREAAVAAVDKRQLAPEIDALDV